MECHKAFFYHCMLLVGWMLVGFFLWKADAYCNKWIHSIAERWLAGKWTKWRCTLFSGWKLRMFHSHVSLWEGSLSPCFHTPFRTLPTWEQFPSVPMNCFKGSPHFHFVQIGCWVSPGKSKTRLILDRFMVLGMKNKFASTSWEVS